MPHAPPVTTQPPPPGLPQPHPVTPKGACTLYWERVYIKAPGSKAVCRRKPSGVCVATTVNHEFLVNPSGPCSVIGIVSVYTPTASQLGTVAVRIKGKGVPVGRYKGIPA